MSVGKHWTIDIYLSEEIGEGTAVTRAEARLRTQDDATDLRGHGGAHRHPDDDVPEIGDELATARALSDLANQLLHAAAQDVAAVTRQPRLGFTA